jgi:hypothetical protein
MKRGADILAVKQLSDRKILVRFRTDGGRVVTALRRLRDSRFILNDSVYSFDGWEVELVA